MSQITELASSQINHDHLSVELVEPDGMPAMVRIVWPTANDHDPGPLSRGSQHSHAVAR